MERFGQNCFHTNPQTQKKGYSYKGRKIGKSKKKQDVLDKEIHLEYLKSLKYIQNQQEKKEKEEQNQQEKKEKEEQNQQEKKEKEEQNRQERQSAHTKWYLDMERQGWTPSVSPFVY